MYFSEPELSPLFESVLCESVTFGSAQMMGLSYTQGYFTVDHLYHTLLHTPEESSPTSQPTPACPEHWLLVMPHVVHFLPGKWTPLHTLAWLALLTST